jgi:hypothetical protein
MSSSWICIGERKEGGGGGGVDAIGINGEDQGSVKRRRNSTFVVKETKARKLRKTEQIERARAYRGKHVKLGIRGTVIKVRIRIYLQQQARRRGLQRR